MAGADVLKAGKLSLSEGIAAFFPECCSEEEVEKLLREASEELSCIEERAKFILPEEVGTKQRTDAKLFGLGMVQRFLLSALRDADCVDRPAL